MKLSLMILFSLSALHANADVIKGKIHNIIDGADGNPDIVQMENGRVVFVDKKDSELMRSLEVRRGGLEIMTDEENHMRAARSTDKIMSAPFEPTVLGNKGEVQKVFNRLNRRYQRESQCFNRAHIWANDEFKNNGIKSEKVFVFFTASYIWKYKFNWWFHVAPLMSYKSNGNVEKAVLDYRYADKPLSIKEWTDIFVFSSRPCLVTTKFSDYDVNPQTEDCYLITTNMYFWQPNDIKTRDTTGLEMENFGPGSIYSANAEAF